MKNILLILALMIAPTSSYALDEAMASSEAQLLTLSWACNGKDYYNNFNKVSKEFFHDQKFNESVKLALSRIDYPQFLKEVQQDESICTSNRSGLDEILNTRISSTKMVEETAKRWAKEKK
jgi:hypothetical protein